MPATASSAGTLVGYQLAVIASVNAQDTYVVLDPTRMYFITHTGFDATGAIDLNSVVFAIDRGYATPALVVNSFAESVNKYVAVANAGAFPIGPGATSMTYQPIAGAPVFSIYATVPQRQGW